MNEENKSVEFKVGDRVRIINKEKDNHTGVSYEDIGVDFMNPSSYIGKIANITHIKNSSLPFMLGETENKKYLGLYTAKDLELVEEKEVIIRCPTKELWDKVMEKENNIGNNFWDDYKEKSCLRIKDGKFKGFGNVEYYQEQYQENPIISAGEYLGDTLTEKDIQGAVDTLDNSGTGFYNLRSYTNMSRFGFQDFSSRYPTQEVNKPKHKFMQTLTNTLKKILPSDIQKQYRAGLRNGDLALTGQGNFELLELLADTFKKELTDRAIEIIKEEEKKK